jgi:hypothetical protein
MQQISQATNQPGNKSATQQISHATNQPRNKSSHSNIFHAKKTNSIAFLLLKSNHRSREK